MPVEANSFGAEDGMFVVLVDELDSEVCNNLSEVNRLVFSAFSHGAMKVVVNRWLPDLPNLKPKKVSGVVYISQE